MAMSSNNYQDIPDPLKKWFRDAHKFDIEDYTQPFTI